MCVRESQQFLLTLTFEQDRQDSLKIETGLPKTKMLLRKFSIFVAFEDSNDCSYLFKLSDIHALASLGAHHPKWINETLSKQTAPTTHAELDVILSMELLQVQGTCSMLFLTISLEILKHFSNMWKQSAAAERTLGLESDSRFTSFYEEPHAMQASSFLSLVLS